MKDITNRFEGVGLLLLSNKGRLLILKELESKPIIQKVEGMLTFPLETVELHEGHSDTLERLLTEEVGTVTMHALRQLQSFEFIHPDCKVRIHMYSAKVNAEFVAEPADSDVIHHGWMTPIQLLEHAHKRIEVDPIIRSHFFHS